MRRRNLLLALGGSATASGALFGTQAFSTITAERTARVKVVGDGEALLVLEPVPGEERPGQETATDSNAYAEERDDELNIDVDGYDTGSGESKGVNPNATTRIPEVIRIGNQGTQPVDVTIVPYRSADKAERIEDVRFYDESNESGTNVENATVEPGETGDSALVVGIEIDTTDDSGETDVDELGLVEIEASAQ